MTYPGRLEIDLQVREDVSPLEVDQLTAAMRRELLQLDVEGVDRVSAGPPPPAPRVSTCGHRGVDREPRDRGHADPRAGGRGGSRLDRPGTRSHGEADSRRRQPGAWRHVRATSTRSSRTGWRDTPARLRPEAGHGGPTKRPDRRDEPVRGCSAVDPGGTGARRRSPAGRAIRRGDRRLRRSLGGRFPRRRAAPDARVLLRRPGT